MTDPNSKLPPLNSRVDSLRIQSALDVKPKGKVRRVLPYAATGIVALLIGAGLGSVGGSGGDSASQPAPAVTVTAPALPTKDACKTAAVELFAIAETMNNEIQVPQNEVIASLVSQLQGGVSITEIEAATVKLDTVTSVSNGLSARIAALSPDYLECTQ